MAVLRVRCTTESALPCPNPFVHCDGRLPSGKLLPMLWGLVKHFLDARTRSKVKFINTQEELLKSLPAEYVPTAYGGSSTHAFDPATCGLVSGE